MQLSLADCDAFDCLNLATLDLRDRHQTTVHDAAIDQYRARAALAFAAAFLGSSQSQLLAQNVEQALHRISLQLPRFGINRAVDLNLFRQDSL